jgi:hypothetical protein
MIDQVSMQQEKIAALEGTDATIQGSNASTHT